MLARHTSKLLRSSSLLRFLSVPGDPVTSYVRFKGPDGKIRYGQPEQGACPKTEVRVIEGDIFGDCKLSDRMDVALQILPPIDPVAVYAIGLNYKKHAAEAKLPIPAFPAVFMKATSSITGPFDDIVVPKCASQKPEVDYEGELVIVIGKDCKDVSKEDALDYVHGYCIGNDVSARRWQGNKKSSGQWTRAKSFDTFSPIGPQIVLQSQLNSVVDKLQLSTRLNDKIMQNSNTSDMIWNVADIVSFLSEGTTLKKGTIIFTGTPEGVGFVRKPYVYLKEGDIVRVAIEGLGFIENKVRFE